MNNLSQNNKYYNTIAFGILINFILLFHLVSPIFCFADNSGIDNSYDTPVLSQCSGSNQKVLFISSYAYDWASVPLEIDGIESVLSEKYDTKYMFMNTKNVDTEFAESVLAQRLDRQILSHDTKFDIVILGDDAALDFAVKYKDKYFSDTPLVFFGINTEDKAYEAAKDKNITGVVETFPISETINLAKQLYPKANKVVGISDDTVSGQGSLQQFYDSKNDFPDMEFSDIDCSELTADEIKSQISNLNENTILMYLLFSEDKNKYYYSLNESIELLSENTHIPMFKTDELGIGSGIIGGNVVSYKNMASEAAMMAYRVLNGENIADIKPETVKSQIIFDYNILRKFNINEKVLPKNALILNKKTSYFQKNKTLFMIVGSIIVVLLLFLLFFIYDNLKRRKLIKSISEKDDILNKLVYSATFKIRDNGIDVLHMSKGIPELFGMAQNEFIKLVHSDKFPDTFIYTEDLDRLKNSIRKSIKNDTSINISFRLNTKNLTPIWVQMNGVKIREEEGYPVYAVVLTGVSDETKMYKKILDDSSTGIYVTSIATHEILYLNNAMYKFGVNNESEIFTKKCYELFFNREEPCEFCTLEKMNYNEFLTREFPMPNSKKHFNLKGRLIEWNGIPAHIEYIQEDTAAYNARKRQEDLINNFPGGAGIFEYSDGEFKRLFINDGYYKIVDRPKDTEASDNTITSLKYIHTNDRKIVIKKLKNLVITEGTASCTVRVLKGTEDNYIWLNMTGSVVEKTKGKCLFYVSFFDVNSAKLASLELENANKNLAITQRTLNTAIEHSDLKFWEYYPDKNYAVQSLTVTENIDVTNIMQDYPNSWYKSGITHPEDLEKLKEFQEKAKHGEPDIICEIRNKYKDKDYHWEKLHYTTMFDENHKMIKVIGTALDISEQKNAEKKFRDEIVRKTALEADSYSSIVLNVTNDKVVDIKTSTLKNQLLDSSCINFSVSKCADMMKSGFLNEDEYENFKINISRDNLMKHYLSNDLNFSVKYKILNCKDEIMCLSADISMTKEPKNNDVLAFIYTHDETKEILEKDVLESVVEEEVDFVSYLDVKSNSVMMIKHRKNANRIPSLEKRDYTESNKHYIPKFIPEDEIKSCFEKYDINNIIKQLSVKNEYIIIHSLKSISADTPNLRVKTRIYYLDKYKKTIVFVRSDITDVYYQEKQKNNILQSALDDAKKANAAKSDFLSRMSHEIRTPMNAVLGMAKLGIEESVDSSAVDYFKKIDSSGTFLLGLINDILDMSRIESQKVKLNPNVVNMNDFFSSILTIIEPLCDAKKIELVFDKSGITRKYGIFDKMRAQQILINILNNAIKFSDEGSKIEFTALSQEKEGELFDTYTINDYGVGMSEDFLKRIFQPFEQERNKYATEQSGTGLGLAISKNLVTLMNGDITVKSKLGEGSTFTVTIPAVKTDNENDIKQSIVDNNVVSEDILDGKVILLAEDHPLNTEITIKLLKKKGIDVVHAENGSEAVRLFKESKDNYFSAILMDIKMPIMGGLEATEVIRSLDRADAKVVPIIAMTANAFDVDIQNSINSGMNAHLSKPVNPKELYQTLAYYISI